MAEPAAQEPLVKEMQVVVLHIMEYRMRQAVVVEPVQPANQSPERVQLVVVTVV
jgi:hypothetical protein